MWKQLFLFVSFVGLCLLPAGTTAEVIDRVVAIVNDDLISLSDLNREGREFIKQVLAKTPANDQARALKGAQHEVLSGLIDKMIAAQKAKERGITVTDQEVDEAIQGIMDRNRVSREAFLRDLTNMGETEESYRRLIHTQILQSKLVNYEVRAKIVITDDQIRDFYGAKYVGKVGSPGYHILQMGFSWNNGPDKIKSPAEQAESKALAEKRAQKTREMVLAGADFKELARLHSDLPSAADGGDIGLFKEEEMAPYMLAAIKDLKPGEITPVQETASGYQFFQLLAFEKDVTSFDAVKEQIREQLYQEELKKQFEKWVQELRSQAYIKELL